MSADAQPARRIAIITGAARGIGAATALRLAQDGHDIAVLDLDRAACGQTVEAVQGAGRRALAVSGDVTDEAAVRAAVAQVATELGPPTVLVNNAGVLVDHTIAKMTLEEWDAVIAVHLRGAFLMSRETQAHMRAAGWGRIVNLSSISALGYFGQAGYSTAKAGLQGLTKTLALELARHQVTVNAVAPGFTITGMTRAKADDLGMPFEQMIEETVAHIPVRRAGEPEDIAHAVSFFVDERSSFVSGQVLYVAGGPRG